MLILRIQTADPGRIAPTLDMTSDIPVNRMEVAQMLRTLSLRVERGEENESQLWQVTPKPDGSCDVKPAPAPTPSKAQWVGQIVQTRVAQGATNLRTEVEQAQTAYDAIYGAASDV